MKANKQFTGLGKDFWGYIRFLGDKIGYSKRRGGQITIYKKDQVLDCLNQYNLKVSDKMLHKILSYVGYRQDILNNFVEKKLMKKAEAANKYSTYKSNFLKKYSTIKSPQPMNKQKGNKRKIAYFTCSINLITENAINTFNKEHNTNITCNYDPRELTFLRNDKNPDYLKETLSRRFDGAIPSLDDPVSIWEIKEYYNTTSFGSRVADGVYETLLDGHEIHDIYGFHPTHNFLVDGYETWWRQGKSYLCRIIDSLNMGYVDEVIFGSEIFDIWYKRVQEACSKYHSIKNK